MALFSSAAGISPVTTPSSTSFWSTVKLTVAARAIFAVRVTDVLPDGTVHSPHDHVVEPSLQPWKT